MVPRRYDVVRCTVARHVPYGVIVTVDAGERGWIEGDHIRGDRSLQRDRWPALGTQLDAVVLGVTKDGRVRLCSLPSYVEAIRGSSDPVAAEQAWSRARKAGSAHALPTGIDAN